MGTADRADVPLRSGTSYTPYAIDGRARTRYAAQDGRGVSAATRSRTSRVPDDSTRRRLRGRRVRASWRGREPAITLSSMRNDVAASHTATLNS